MGYLQSGAKLRTTRGHSKKGAADLDLFRSEAPKSGSVRKGGKVE